MIAVEPRFYDCCGAALMIRSVEYSVETLVRCASVAVDVFACSFACLIKSVSICDKSVHDIGEGLAVFVFERASACFESLCLTEFSVVRAENDGNAIHGGFWHVVYADAESSAHQRYFSIAVDG